MLSKGSDGIEGGYVTATSALRKDDTEDRPSTELAQSSDMKALLKYCHSYKTPHAGKAAFQLANTLLAFVSVLTVMLAGFYHQAYWVEAILLIPASLLLVRVFVLQHDCGHGSFFPSKRANDITGSVLSVLTFTPYDLWRRAHNMHHTGSGNLDRRGTGSIDTLTVREYAALTPWQKFVYRFYRHPAVLLVFGPPVYVLIMQRFPPTRSVPYLDKYIGLPLSQTLRSAMLLNLSLVGFYGAAMMIFGVKAVLAVYLPVIITAYWFGQWLFYMQHQFENTSWEYDEKWNFAEGAVNGSSFYNMPRILHWFTGNIGYHHIHHLCASIPNYNLQACFENNEALSKPHSSLTLFESLKCMHLALWDEGKRRMISFRELGRAAI